jgi:uncharacterized membrane protein
MDESTPIGRNIQSIAELEKAALHDRSAAQRISDAFTKFIGSMIFVVLHLIWFGVWVFVNLNLIPGVTPFDPFPFGILTLIVSSEGVLLAIFVLISQNRMSRMTDRRAHLDLQISLLAEQEMTKALQMLQTIGHHVGAPVETHNTEVQQLMEETCVPKLVDELEERLPNE